METDSLASGNYFLPLSHVFFKESFIPISGNAYFCPKEQNCLLFKAFFSASEKHYLNYREAFSKPLLLLLATMRIFWILLSMEAVFPSNRNVFANEFSILGGGNRLSVYPVDTRRKLNVRNTFRRRPGRLLNVLYTLNLRLVSTR